MRWPYKYDYHRWHIWFALFPVEIGGKRVWLEWYRWRHHPTKSASFGWYFERETLDGSLHEECYRSDGY